MKRHTMPIVFFAITQLVFAQSGSLRQDPLAITPTWRGHDSQGNNIQMRERPLSITPTYDLRGSGGYRGTVQPDPLGITPTWEGHDNQGNDLRMRERPLGITPMYDLSPGN